MSNNHLTTPEEAARKLRLMGIAEDKWDYYQELPSDQEACHIFKAYIAITRGGIPQDFFQVYQEVGGVCDRETIRPSLHFIEMAGKILNPER